MPTITARSMWGASASVRPNVDSATSAWGLESCQSRYRGAILTRVAAAKITTAARIACGSGSSTEAAGRKASTARPVTIALNDVRAPARRLIALREKELPTGKPPETAAATLAMPCPMNSRSASQGLRSTAAYVRAIAAASAKPSRAITAPGTRSDGRSVHGRSSEKGGKPAEMDPTVAPSKSVNSLYTIPPTTTSKMVGSSG